MNYIKIYTKIIEKSKNRTLTTYSENHHIIPKCLGGSNSKSNIAILTAKEHYIVHLLLTKIYPDNNKLKYALWMMSNGSIKHRGIKVSSRAYSEIKEIISKLVRKHLGTKEAIEKMSKSKKGKTPWLGKKHSEESKIRQSNSAKTRKTNIENESARRNGIAKGLSKPVLQYNLEGELIKEWCSTAEATRQLNLSTGSIVRVCNGKFKSHKGFIYRYK